MIELIASITITAGSVLLFCYWFRYTCFLILSAQTVREYATSVAQANQLSFLETQAHLAEASPDLDRLKNALDRDYAVIAGLLSKLDAEQSGMEQRMLAIHYRLMGVWYRTSRNISASAASKALEEMSMVLAHFANSIGEASASAAA
jgi:hypothetical protein